MSGNAEALHHLLGAVRRILEKASPADLLRRSNHDLRPWLLPELRIMGEQAAGVNTDVQRKYAALDWEGLRALKELSEDSFLSDDTAWTHWVEELPRLQERLEKILFSLL